MINRHFSNPVTVERLTVAPNGMGGSIETWTTHIETTGVIDALGGDERLSADKATLYATHVLICPVVDIKEADRVKAYGNIYQVKFVDNPMNKNIHLEVSLELKGYEQL